MNEARHTILERLDRRFLAFILMDRVRQAGGPVTLRAAVQSRPRYRIVDELMIHCQQVIQGGAVANDVAPPPGSPARETDWHARSWAGERHLLQM